jgi:hypothetical protein
MIGLRRPGRTSATVGLLARAVFVAAIAAATSAQAEMTVPIKGHLAPERVSAEVGATLTFRLEVSTTVAFKRVAVRLTVPDGMTLVAGIADAEIANFGPGENRAFEYRLRLDRLGEKKVWAEAEVLGIAPAIMRSPFGAVVNPADAGKPPPTIVKDGQGNSYQVQGISRKPSP